MISRFVHSLVAGIVVGLLAALALFIISALIPKFTVDASWWAGIIGLLAFLYDFFVGTDRLNHRL